MWVGHGGGFSTLYGHQSRIATRDGAHLSQGQLLGYMGNTGHSTGPHLHLQLQPATSYPQEEAWFQGFAGRAFTWQDAPTPTLATAPVFTVVEDEPAADDVLTFTLRS